jgi:hypothetical protein
MVHGNLSTFLWSFLVMCVQRNTQSIQNSGSPPKIPANAWLTFEVELLSWSPIREKVTEDGGVAKQTITKNADEYHKPNDGATCRYNLTVSVGTAKEAKVVHTIDNATTVVGGII